MKKFLGLLFGASIASIGVWKFDATSSKVAWAVAVLLLASLVVFTKRGPNRAPKLRLGFTIIVVISAFVSTIIGGDRPQLGLDLQGGVSIVLFPVEGSDLSQLDTAVDIIFSRINSLGATEPEVSRQGSTIVVDIPGLKDPERAVEVVGRTACLRFRAVLAGPVPATATVPETTTTVATTSSVATTTTGKATTSTAVTTTTVATEGSSTTAAVTSSTTTSTTVAGPTTTTVPPPKLNCDVSSLAPPDLTLPSTPLPEDPASATLPSADPGVETTAQAAGLTISTQPILASRPLQTPTTQTTTTTVPPPTTTTVAATTTTLAPGTNICESYVKEDDPDTASWVYDKDKSSCYLLGETILTGRSIADAEAAYEQQWVVNVEFKNDDFVTKVAMPNVGKYVAIVLDDRVQSAPKINEGITGRNVQISGSFTDSESKDLALVLKYGSLPIQFDESQTTRQSVSPSLGKDQLSAGIAAGAFGLALVALFMVLYYRLLGFVVWVGLSFTGLIFFVLVSFLGDAQGLTLTLAGVTGLIVSVGVTVDSYVVYFERLKDEVRSGKTIRSSIDVGFTKAFRTIVAADLVSLIGAAVLYFLAIGSVRGFAYFLGLSTLIDLTIAFFFMYPLVSFIAKRPGLIKMRRLGIAAGLDVAGKVDA